MSQTQKKLRRKPSMLEAKCRKSIQDPNLLHPHYYELWAGALRRDSQPRMPIVVEQVMERDMRGLGRVSSINVAATGRVLPSCLLWESASRISFYLLTVFMYAIVTFPFVLINICFIALQPWGNSCRIHYCKNVSPSRKASQSKVTLSSQFRRVFS